LCEGHYKHKDSEEYENCENLEHFSFYYVLSQSAAKTKTNNKTPNPIPNATNPKVFKEMVDVNNK
jgi:hypothetical protein